MASQARQKPGGQMKKRKSNFLAVASQTQTHQVDDGGSDGVAKQQELKCASPL